MADVSSRSDYWLKTLFPKVVYSDELWGGSIGPYSVRQDNLWLPNLAHCFLRELQCDTLVSGSFRKISINARS